MENDQFTQEEVLDLLEQVSDGGVRFDPRNDLWLKIDFGGLVKTDKVVIYIRADFPHDNY